MHYLIHTLAEDDIASVISLLSQNSLFHFQCKQNLGGQTVAEQTHATEIIQGCLLLGICHIHSI